MARLSDRDAIRSAQAIPINEWEYDEEHRRFTAINRKGARVFLKSDLHTQAHTTGWFTYSLRFVHGDQSYTVSQDDALIFVGPLQRLYNRLYRRLGVGARFNREEKRRRKEAAQVKAAARESLKRDLF